MGAKNQVKLPHCWLWAKAASTSQSRKRFKQPSRRSCRTWVSKIVKMDENGAFTIIYPWSMAIFIRKIVQNCYRVTLLCLNRSNHDVQQWMERAFPILFSEMGRSLASHLFCSSFQALKIFRDQGHLKGEIAAMHRLARVDQATCLKGSDMSSEG